jgi:HNH endonuclease
LTTEHRAALSEVRTGVFFSEERRRAVAEGRIRNWNKPYYAVEDRGYETPCWIWARAMLKTGYGAVKRGGKTLRAHRWMYEQAVGPIPSGKHLDHLCCVRACVRPEHLDPVTKHENELRAAARRRAGQRPS